jgi:hypothetical protein
VPSPCWIDPLHPNRPLLHPVKHRRYNHGYGIFWGRLVTICIGAIAERDSAIVMVADRALSVGSLQTTATGPGKIYRLASSWYVLVAGDVSFAEGIIVRARQQLSSDASLCGSVLQVQSCLEGLYRQQRDEAIESQILRPQLLTIPLYRSRPSTLHPLDKAHYDAIRYAIENYSAQTDLMVCGFDSAGCPHILGMQDPGVCKSYDPLGYHAVGIGAEAALVRLSAMSTDRHDPLAKAIYNVFDAKVSTEEYQGISYEWDGEVLCKGQNKSRKIPRPLINMLDSEYRAFPQSPFDEWHREPSNWRRKLDAFAKRVAPNTATPKPNYVFRSRKRA